MEATKSFLLKVDFLQALSVQRGLKVLPVYLGLHGI